MADPELADPGSAPDSTTEQAAIDLAMAKQRIDALASSLPVIEPPKANRLLSGAALALLLIFGFLGSPPWGALATPKPVAATAGKAAVLDPDIETVHQAASKALRIAFDASGCLKSATALTAEGELPILTHGNSLQLRVTDSEGYEEQGRNTGLRLVERGLRIGRRYFAGNLTGSTTVLLGKDEAGADRPFVDVLIRLKNASEKEEEFSYTLLGVEDLPPMEDDRFYDFRGVVLGDRRGPDGEVKGKGIQWTSSFSEKTQFYGVEAVGVLARYRMAVLTLVSEGSVKAERQARIQTPGSDGFGFSLYAERIKLAPGAELVHHYRLILGPRSDVTTAGHGLDAFISDSWPNTRFFRSLSLNFVRGILRLGNQFKGWALLLGGLLAALALRPYSMVGAWTSARGPAISGLRKELAALTKLETDEAPDRKTKRELEKYSGGVVASLLQRHSQRPVMGCLMWLFVLMMAFGFHDAVKSDHAMRGATFLWIKDLAKPDRFYELDEPVFRKDLLAPVRDKAPPGSPLSNVSMVVELDAIHLLPILLLLLIDLEMFWLWWRGVQVRRGLFGWIFHLAFFALLLYNLPSGFHLSFLSFDLVWVYDRINAHRRVLAGAAPAAALSPEANAPA